MLSNQKCYITKSHKIQNKIRKPYLPHLHILILKKSKQTNKKKTNEIQIFFSPVGIQADQ